MNADENFKTEIKNGIMYDRHTLYYKCFCNETTLRKAIELYIKRARKHVNKRNVNPNYHLNFIELNGTSVGYGHIYFAESAYFYMLTKRKPSGSKHGKVVPNPNYVNYEERMKITDERYRYYKQHKATSKSKILWSWVFEFDYPDEDEELNNNTKTLFIEEDYETLGDYLVDEYCIRSINSYVSFRKSKAEADEPSGNSAELLEKKAGDVLKINTYTITFKYNDYMDTLLIFNYPNHIKNEEIVTYYQVFFENDIKNYIKKINNKLNSIEVQFKIKEYAQLLNAICRTMKVKYKNDEFLLKNKPINK